MIHSPISHTQHSHLLTVHTFLWTINLRSRYEKPMKWVTGINSYNYPKCHQPSKTGLDCNNCSFTLSTSQPLPDTAATYCITTLDASEETNWKDQWWLQSCQQQANNLKHPDNKLTDEAHKMIQYQTIEPACFSSSTFARDYNTLILVVISHGSVGIISYGIAVLKNMQITTTNHQVLMREVFNKVCS